MSKKPDSMAEVLRHLADGKIVGFCNSTTGPSGSVEYRCHPERGIEARLSPQHEWFAVAINLRWRLDDCVLLDEVVV